MYKHILFISMLYSLANSDAKMVLNQKAHPYGTHQPVLYEMAMQTTGPIIEFGCGNSSTDLLHEICKKDQRLLISIDDNLEWLNKFKNKYNDKGCLENNSGWHKFIFVPGKDLENAEDPSHWVTFLEESELLKTIVFDICFIDQHPWMGRVETMKRMKGRSKYFILHDFNYFPMYNIFGRMLRLAFNGDPGEFDFSDVYKYFKTYFPLNPWPAPYGPGTLLASDTESNFPDIDFNLY